MRARSGASTKSQDPHSDDYRSQPGVTGSQTSCARSAPIMRFSDTQRTHGSKRYKTPASHGMSSAAIVVATSQSQSQSR